MEAWIETIAHRAGIAESKTQSCVVALLQLLRERAGESDFSLLAERLSGTTALLEHAPPLQDLGPGAPGISGLVARALSMVGGPFDSVVGLTNRLGYLGLKGDEVNTFVATFLEVARDQAGSDLVDRLVARVPPLRSLGAVGAEAT